MRRRISLYIGESKADLSEDNLVLMTYQLTDLFNPSVIKNSYSRTVVLPGTPNNNTIFGESFRLDRVIGGTGGHTGFDFDASKRTPFTIYNELNEVLASGYCKLTDIQVTDGVPAYSLELYGGLGSFLYGLSQKGDGSKMTLADLDYLGGGANELDFVINATNVRAAWDRILGDSSKPAMWDVINFAPCYNGIPSDFAADKAVAKPGDIGVPDTYQDPDSLVDYDPKSGYIIVNLSNEFDEWAVKDMRSYLQRPVISMAKVLNAIADPDNNGGWTVDLTDISSSVYFSSWLTLPLLPSLGGFKQEAATITTSFASLAWTTAPTIGRVSLANVPSNTKTTVNASVRIAFRANASSISPLRSWHRVEFQSYTPNGYTQQILFVQAVAYDSNNTKVAASRTQAFYKSFDLIDAVTLANAVGYSPDSLNTEMAAAQSDQDYTLSGGDYVRGGSVSLQVEGMDIDHVDIVVKAYRAHITDNGAVFSHSGGTKCGEFLADSSGNEYAVTNGNTIPGTAIATTFEITTLRSGALVTKSLLLSTSRTPADYLIGFCRLMGFAILVDEGARSVSIVSRNTLFDNTTIDLTDRVDSRSVGITPLAYDRKWYALQLEGVGGAFEKQYKEVTGREYGSLRVDTGYDFDAEEKKLLDGIALKSAAPVLDTNKYWCMLQEPVSVSGTITNSQYIADVGSISMAANTFNVLRVHVVKSGTYTVGTNLQNPNHTVMAEYQDQNFNYQLRVVIGPGTYTTKTVYLSAGYYAVCSDGNNTNLTVNGYALIPSPFLDTNNTYALWDTDGNSIERPISNPPATVNVQHYNQVLNNYDFAAKPEFRDAKNDPVDGTDVLLLFAGQMIYDQFQLTDDLSIMNVVNDGEPCWILQQGGSLTMPHFNRYKSLINMVTLKETVMDSLDIAVPRQTANPMIGTYLDNKTIGGRKWEAFLEDRLDANNKVLRCKVDLRGLQVGAGLLRHFYYFRHAVWVMTKISNYSLTTYDFAECEFVKVKDTTNYTNGQS